MAEVSEIGKKKRKKDEETEKAVTEDSNANLSVTENDDKTTSSSRSCTADKMGDGNPPEIRKLSTRKLDPEPQESPAKKKVSVLNSGLPIFILVWQKSVH